MLPSWHQPCSRPPGTPGQGRLKGPAWHSNMHKPGSKREPRCGDPAPVRGAVVGKRLHRSLTHSGCADMQSPTWPLRVPAGWRQHHNGRAEPGDILVALLLFLSQFPQTPLLSPAATSHQRTEPKHLSWALFSGVTLRGRIHQSQLLSPALLSCFCEPVKHVRPRVLHLPCL